jgi:thiamine biosynthesis lipoprotein
MAWCFGPIATGDVPVYPPVVLCAPRLAAPASRSLSRQDDRVATLLGLGLEPVAPATPACQSARIGRNAHRVWTVRPAMATAVSVVVLDASPALAEEAIEAAFRELARLVVLFSRHDPGAAVAQLNAAGGLGDVPPELARVVGRALHYHRLTAGAFDVTVTPLVDLLRACRGAPTTSEWKEAAELVGAEHVELSAHALRFRRSGMAMTLDGIAKGYIVDRMSDVLVRHGARQHLVDAGGDIRVRGGKPDGRPWTVGVRDPSDPDRLVDVVPLVDGAIATSGNYEKDHRHLVGAGAEAAPAWNRSASVIAPAAMAADALATALFVTPPTAGPRLARKVPGCEYLILDSRGDKATSPGWASTAAKAGGE